MSTSSAGYIFDILRLIGEERAPLGATDVSRRLDLSLTTAHRGLNTLERTDFISRYQSSTKYVLGDMSRNLVHSFFARFALRDIAIPYMQRLAAMSGETVALFVDIGWYAVRIASVKGTNEVIHSGPLGDIWHLDQCAAGRAIAAFFPEDKKTRFLGVLEQRTSAVDRARLEKALESVERDRYAIGMDEFESGHFAMPIVREEGHSVGALAIEGNVAAMNGEGGRSDADAYLPVVAQLSQAGGSHFNSIYAHIDPDTIHLPTVRRPPPNG